MRLINTATLKLEQFSEKDRPDYAVLSHRWLSPAAEVTYADFMHGDKQDSPGWAKIKDACRTALDQNLQYCWIDTCCINKDSSAEETRSINSMFKWYEKATKAFAYLGDVVCDNLDSDENAREFAGSIWFTRGWTLQELLAPPDVTFFNRFWEALGTKCSLASLVSKQTSIDEEVLRGEISYLECSIASRMYWAANRETTVLEDQAYCLLGIFDVNMPLLYGEGEKAFLRLQEEILQRSTDQTIFAWSSAQPVKGILAPRPSCFSTSHGKDLHRVLDYFPDDPAGDSYTLGNAGLTIDFVLIPWTMNTYLAPLRCFLSGKFTGGDPTQRLCLVLRQTRADNRFVRVSVDGADLIVKRYLRVPKEPSSNYFDRNQLHRRVLIARQPFMMIKDSFYGFRFNFWSPALFDTGSKPDAKDVVSETTWDRNSSQLQIKHGRYRIAGIFRLSGMKPKPAILLFGFDVNFNPFAYFAAHPYDIIKKHLPLLDIDREIIAQHDLGKMSHWGRSSWLDGMYIQKLIDDVVRTAREQPGDWPANSRHLGLMLGERNTAEQLFNVPNTKLRILMKNVASHPETHWRVTLKEQEFTEQTPRMLDHLFYTRSGSGQRVPTRDDTVSINNAQEEEKVATSLSTPL